MNILRWKRKSKKKIKFKTLVLFIFSLIMTTFAWFAYSKVLDTTLKIHISSWDMEYYINNVEKTNPIGIDIPTLYPAMQEEVVTVDIKNNGETLVDIDYTVKSLAIAGIPFELIYEGETPTTDNYIVLTPSITETDPITGEKVSKGVITNDIEKLPFTIEIEHSAQIEKVTEDQYGNTVSGTGYLNVIVNWVGDNNELDSHWGYIVGQYLTQNPTLPAMTISLSIDSYEANPAGETIEVILPSTAETVPYLPTGYTRVPGTTLDNGLVVKDSAGNEFVWVEVPRTTTVYGTAGLAIKNFTAEEYTKIEADLKTYSGAFNTRDDAYTSYQVTGLAEEDYIELKQKMLKSIYRHGGFYIGRYETGIANSYRTTASESTPTETPVIKANAYPFNYVTSSQAQTIAKKLQPTGYASNLMFGLQWDLVMKYLQVNGTPAEDLTTDSTLWGNYKNSEHDIMNLNAKYLLSSGSTWLETPYSKTEEDELLLTTGSNSVLSEQNIYDLAGNLAEWTFNFIYSDGKAVGGNGGDYTVEGTVPATNRASYNSAEGKKHIGFRVSLFLDLGIGPEATGSPVGGNAGGGGSGGDGSGGGGSEGDGSGEIGGENNAPITQITLDKTSEELTIGENLTLTATINSDAEESITWESSNPNVATVTENSVATNTPKTVSATITAIGEGTTIITAKNTDGSISQSCMITVVEEENDMLQGTWYLNDTVNWFNNTYYMSFYIEQEISEEEMVSISHTGQSSGLQSGKLTKASGAFNYIGYRNNSWVSALGRTWTIHSTIDEVTDANGSATAGEDLYNWLCENATKLQ